MPPFVPRLLALAAAALLSPTAWSGRPLSTEDAGVLEPRACEFEPSFAQLRADGQRVRATVVQVACGIGLRTQLYVNVQRVGETAAASATDQGLGAKTALMAGEDGAASLTLAYGGTLARQGDGRRWRDAFVNLVASGEVSDGLSVHANLGLVRLRDEQRTLRTWNLAAEQAMGGGVDLVAEVYGHSDKERWFGTGTRYTEGDWSFNAGAARQLRRPKATLLSVGAKWNF